MTQQQVADRWGKSRATVANIERDAQGTLVSSLPALAAILNVTPAALLGDTSGGWPDLTAIYEAGRSKGHEEMRRRIAAVLESAPRREDG